MKQIMCIKNFYLRHVIKAALNFILRLYWTGFWIKKAFFFINYYDIQMCERMGCWVVGIEGLHRLTFQLTYSVFFILYLMDSLFKQVLKWLDLSIFGWLCDLDLWPTFLKNVSLLLKVWKTHSLCHLTTFYLFLHA